MYLSVGRRRLFVMKRGNMGPPTVLELLTSASPVLPGSPCYSHPQVGSLGEASDLLLLRERQECPALPGKVMEYYVLVLFFLDTHSVSEISLNIKISPHSEGTKRKILT